MSFLKSVILGAVGGAGYIAARALYDQQKEIRVELDNESKERQEKLKFYNELKLGSYSPEAIRYLHSKDEETLTAQELFKQLNIYGTHSKSHGGPVAAA